MEELLDLAFDDPDEAERRASQLLSREGDAAARSYAHQCLGIIRRESGLVPEALSELRQGLDAAARSGVADRARDVRATYGATLVLAGRTRAGLDQLDRALDGAHGEVGAKVRMRKAMALALLGRHAEAIPVMREALQDIRHAQDQIWVARTLLWLAHVELRLGRVDEAGQAADEAERVLEEEGAGLERLNAVAYVAEVSLARGDLSAALRLYGEAVKGYEDAGQPVLFDTACDFAKAYLAAGMADHAVEVLEQATRSNLSPLIEADFHRLRAGALVAAGDAERAQIAARRAREMCHRQQRTWFERRAELILVQARTMLGERRGVSGLATRVAADLHREGADEAPLALTLAGRLTKGEDRRRLWQEAASYRNRPNALVRAGAWLARALEREESGDRGGVLRAAAAGLDAIDEHRRLLGSSELRALATTHGKELTTIALRHAAHDPRTLLRWSERTRATALAQPPATSDAATIPASLAALRDNGRRLAEARQAGEPTEELERERLRLERAVRSEHHTLSAKAEEAQRPASAEEVVAGVGDGCLVELVDVDGVLHVLVVHGGRVRRRIAGTTAEVADLLGPTAMLLRRAARGRPASTQDLGQRLQDAILGDAARLIPDGPVVLAPTARLHGLPWALLPTLHDRAFSVVPSAGQWLRAKAVRRPRTRRTVLVAGPALESGGAEVPILAERLDHPELLDGPAATVSDVLERIDGADLVHLATHGRFRADSPLFSALDLADGPLTVHDLERVPRAPYRVVLSACESGVLAPVGAEELLGLAAALFSLGTAGLVCSVAEVNDAATAELMVGLHDGLARGLDPATALLAVRQNAADPVLAGTAASFVALGV